MALEVIGAGLGRTGTMSLKLALERLGAGPCYHMTEVFRHLDHIPVWTSAARGHPVDWDALFDSYGSAVDFPVAAFWRELAEHYPRAKVILTIRDPQRWFDSVKATIFSPLTQEVPESLAHWHEMQREAIGNRVFAGNIEDREHVLAHYNRHNDRVRTEIEPDRLLVYRVAEGWDPLCAFLGVPVPDEPFPKVNSTEEFQAMVPTIMQQGATAADAQKAAGNSPGRSQGSGAC